MSTARPPGTSQPPGASGTPSGHRATSAPRRRICAAILAGSLAIALTGCGATSTTGQPTIATPTIIPTIPLPTASPESTVSTQPTSAVAIDPTLLTVLPASVGGIALIESPEAEIAALAGPELAAVGSAMVAAIAVDAVSGQFVYVVVVRLQPDVMDDQVFRDWRDSYDEGACSQSDGVAGHAETDIAGRTVYVATCYGGVRTYQVWLAGPGILISASDVGDRGLGEQLMADLRP